MAPSENPVRRLLRLAMGVGRRRLVATGIMDGFVGLALLGLLGILATTLTRRGDLLLWPTLAASAAFTATVAILVQRRWRARLAGPLVTARWIDKQTGSRSLRHDLLAAAELLDALDRSPDDAAWHMGSPALARRFANEVAIALTAADLTPSAATPKTAWRWRVLAVAVLLATGGFMATTPASRVGARELLFATDGRPPPPPRPLWSALEILISYPAHTGRPDKRLQNPSGVMRLPAGTAMRVSMTLLAPAEAVTLVALHDPKKDAAAAAPPPEEIGLLREGRRWSGTLIIRGGGLWSAVALDEADDPLADGRRSPLMPFELEPDVAPAIELLPLPADEASASDTDTVRIRFRAHDDFGLRQATLAYMLPPGPDAESGDPTIHRLPIGDAPGGRRWRGRYRWDLSSIPIDARKEIIYWIEIRDNDPGLGWIPLVDPPGKMASSARQRLEIRDEEAEHQANIEDLRELRDFSVDLIAFRLTTDAFTASADAETLGRRVGALRQLHGASESLLIGLTAMIDRLSLDTKVRARDIAALAGIHERLIPLFRREAKIHEGYPEGAEHTEASAGPAFVRKLSVHNQREVGQLEDEIIRLDDLVDGQIIKSIEALMARLQASQQKLVELLEALQAGDESARTRIEQLQQRIREDMRRLTAARQKLRKEVGEEYLNMDAFRVMEARLRNQDLLERLRRGEIDGALEQARGALKETQALRDAIGERLSRDQGEEESRLSPEDAARMKLLRELSRLQDEEKTFETETAAKHQTWREQVKDIRPRDLDRASRRAKKMRADLEAINDARLSPEGREAYEDLREALQRMEAPAPATAPSALELLEGAEQASMALEQAIDGSKADEDEGKALRALLRPLDALRSGLRAPLPALKDTLDKAGREQLEVLERRQAGLRRRLVELMASDEASELPPPGEKALLESRGHMKGARAALKELDLRAALKDQRRASQGIQRAIESLRKSEKSPPSRSSSTEGSTEADQDRSLRDQVVDAMREGKEMDAATKRYYEELLR